MAELSSSLLLPSSQSHVGVLQPRLVETNRFGLVPFRSPLRWESRLISFPPGTEMFHFPGFASCNLFVQLRMTGHDSGRVAPFRNSRLTGCLAPPRDLSQPTTSFIAFWRQGIHLLPFLTCSLRTSFPTLFNFQRAHPAPEGGDEPGACLNDIHEDIPRDCCQTCDCQRSKQPETNGGGERNRTDDPLLAKQVLSQLSYTPTSTQASRAP